MIWSISNNVIAHLNIGSFLDKVKLQVAYALCVYCIHHKFQNAFQPKDKESFNSKSTYTIQYSYLDSMFE